MIVETKPIESIYSKRELQVQYEHMCNKRQTRKFLRECFKEIIQETVDAVEETRGTNEYKENKKLLNITLDLLGILALQKKPVYVKTLVQMLVEKTDIETSAKQVLDQVVWLIKNSLVNAELDSKNRPKVGKKYELTQDKLEIIERYKYMPPMLVKPLPVNPKGNNKSSGYLTIGSDSLILGGIWHEGDICSEVLDKFSRQPLCMNESVLRHIPNNWKSLKEAENTQEYADTLDSFNYFQKHCAEICALMINNGNKFYLTHKYDKRGRVYSQGYHINIQSNAWGKAVVEFHNKELITDEVKFF